MNSTKWKGNSKQYCPQSITSILPLSLKQLKEYGGNVPCDWFEIGILRVAAGAEAFTE